MPSTRITARSKEGSNDSTVVWCEPGSVLDHGVGDAGDHVGVGHHQPGADHEARALLDLPTSVADDLDGGWSGVGDRLLQLGVAGQGHRAGRRRGQLGEDGREPLEREEALDPGEDRRRGGKGVVEGSDDRASGRWPR